MQASGGQPGPGFVTQCVMAARGAAMREVLSSGTGSAWAGRPSSFEFAVNLVAEAEPAFRAVRARELQKNVTQLQGMLQGGGEE